MMRHSDLPALLTAAELAAIEAREGAATPGPWHACHDEDDVPQVAAGAACDEALTYIAVMVGLTPDAEFLAHARTDLPRAVATIRALAEAGARLATSCGHRAAPMCAFSACDCGAVEEQKDALNAWWRLERRVLGEER